MATYPGSSRVLLIGPYDPHCGEYTFLAPPLGVWRLAGVLERRGLDVEVFDPNCCEGPPPEELALRLRERQFDIIGSSTTGMTLRYDLELAHLCRRLAPDALIVAGGMEATFNPELVFELGPFDMIVLGEGERPLIEIVERRQSGADLAGIPGTAVPLGDGRVARQHQIALTPDALAGAVASTPYERMPYEQYWRRLERAYAVGDLATKAEREMRLSEIRSVRLITLNYCPMGCTFCSSTNFLHAAQGATAPIARLDAEACVSMVERIVAAQPAVRTVIFQDDIFVFTSDRRILPLCEGLISAKANGRLPHDLQFISTNRIDAMTPERLAAMRRAGFRVLGFGIENFSRNVLREFNKARIYDYIEPNLSEALRLGITPFLDLILSSPRGSLDDLAETVRQAHRWLVAGCEIGMYPYVIPFSGAPLSSDPELKVATVYTTRHIAGTAIRWEQPSKILPVDPVVREAILEIEDAFAVRLAGLERTIPHVPSRLRSMLWIAASIPVLARAGAHTPEPLDVERRLETMLPYRPAEPAPASRQARRQLHA